MKEPREYEDLRGAVDGNFVLTTEMNQSGHLHRWIWGVCKKGEENSHRSVIEADPRATQMSNCFDRAQAKQPLRSTMG